MDWACDADYLCHYLNFEFKPSLVFSSQYLLSLSLLLPRVYRKIGVPELKSRTM